MPSHGKRCAEVERDGNIRAEAAAVPSRGKQCAEVERDGNIRAAGGADR